MLLEASVFASVGLAGSALKKNSCLSGGLLRPRNIANIKASPPTIRTGDAPKISVKAALTMLVTAILPPTWTE